MDEIRSSASSSLQQTAQICPQGATTIKERLGFMIQNLPDRWLYTIFWKTSQDQTGRIVLTWTAGHFRGPRGIGLGSGSDTEWYYMVSVMRSYSVDRGMLGVTFGSGKYTWLREDHGMSEIVDEGGRVREAGMHGVRTIVCIPIPGCGVIELGSSDMIDVDPALVQLAKSCFLCTDVDIQLSRTGVDSGKVVPGARLEEDLGFEEISDVKKLVVVAGMVYVKFYYRTQK